MHVRWIRNFQLIVSVSEWMVVCLLAALQWTGYLSRVFPRLPLLLAWLEEEAAIENEWTDGFCNWERCLPVVAEGHCCCFLTLSTLRSCNLFVFVIGSLAHSSVKIDRLVYCRRNFTVELNFIFSLWDTRRTRLVSLPSVPQEPTWETSQPFGMSQDSMQGVFASHCDLSWCEDTTFIFCP